MLTPLASNEAETDLPTGQLDCINNPGSMTLSGRLTAQEPGAAAGPHVVCTLTS